MSRCRYWNLTFEEVEKMTYDPDKVVNWEIKCIREPEDAAQFFGVFMYRKGTPFDYEQVKGITYFHNNLDRKELPQITKFLHNKFEGKEMEKGERIFLKGSKEIYSGKDIGALAKELQTKFSIKPIITIEFQDISETEQKESGLPEAKLLPIPGK